MSYVNFRPKMKLAEKFRLLSFAPIPKLKPNFGRSLMVGFLGLADSKVQIGAGASWAKSKTVCIF